MPQPLLSDYISEMAFNKQPSVWGTTVMIPKPKGLDNCYKVPKTTPSRDKGSMASLMKLSDSEEALALYCQIVVSVSRTSDIVLDAEQLRKETVARAGDDHPSLIQNQGYITKWKRFLSIVSVFSVHVRGPMGLEH